MIDTEVLRTLTMPVNPASGQRYRLAIDADCPGCGWCERNFDTRNETIRLSQMRLREHGAHPMIADSCQHGTPWLYRCPLCTPDREVKE